MSGNKKRIPGKERKAAILNAAIPLFAKQGFKGTTIKEISKAANVSEALLYKHFKNKHDLYIELRKFAYSNVDSIATSIIIELTPSTSNLVTIIYALVYIIVGTIKKQKENDLINRLITFSLLENGEFAKIFYENKMGKWIPHIAKHIEAAKNSGDLNDDDTIPPNKIQFVHNLAVGYIHIQYSKIVNYRVTQNELIAQITLFSLRGIGLKENAIQNYFNPKELAESFSVFFLLLFDFPSLKADGRCLLTNKFY